MSAMIRTLVIILITASISFAQENSWTLEMKNRQPLTAATLISLNGDSLLLERNGVAFNVPIDSISKVRSDASSKAIVGSVVGAIIGAGLGFLAAQIFETKTPVYSLYGYSSSSNHEDKGKYVLIGG